MNHCVFVTMRRTQERLGRFGKTLFFNQNTRKSSKKIVYDEEAIWGKDVETKVSIKKVIVK